MCHDSRFTWNILNDGIDTEYLTNCCQKGTIHANQVTSCGPSVARQEPNPVDRRDAAVHDASGSFNKSNRSSYSARVCPAKACHTKLLTKRPTKHCDVIVSIFPMWV